MRKNLLRAGIILVTAALLLFQMMLPGIPAGASTTIVVTVQLNDSNGSGLSGGVVQYYSGGWQSFGTTNSSGEATKGLFSGTYNFRVSYAGASKEKSQNIATNATVAFQTALVTMKLLDSAGTTELSAGAEYYGGGWKTFGSGTTTATMQLLPVNYSFRVSYAGASQERSQNMATNATVLFRTALVTMKLLDSNNSGLAGGAQYYAGGWKTFGSGTTTTTMQLLPVNYSFRVSYAGASQEKSQNVATNSMVVFQTKLVTMKLLDSSNSELAGGAQYYAGGWKTFGSGTTTATMQLLPVNYSFKVSYAGASQEKSQNVATSATVLFRTALVTMKLLDSSNNELTGGAQYYAGGWKTFGSGTTTVSTELLPVSYSFRVSYGGASPEKNQNIGANSTVIFLFGTWYRDADGDGYGDVNNSTQAFSQPQGYVSDGTDCNDGDGTIYPGAPELCDGKDNDCDGDVDEGAPTWYQDADGDGYGNPAVSTQNCTQPAGYVADNTDCNDGDKSIYPGAPELADGKDNDCDGSIDEGIAPAAVPEPIVWYILVTQSTQGGKATGLPGGNFPYAGSQGFSAYYPDTAVNLVAVPDAGYRFVGWTGGGDVIANVDATTTTITMTRDCCITANFVKIPETPEMPQYNLTISSNAGGVVTVPGEGAFACNCSTVHDLVARADSGYRFVNWTGDVTTIANVNGASTTITMNDDCSVIANFALVPPGRVTLTVSSSLGGAVTTPGEATFTYDEGTVANLKAEPEEGYQFVRWIGDVDDIADVTDASTTISMNGAHSVIATFRLAAGCFIATAAYGTPMAEDIQILRDFRDEYLVTNPVGEALVELYYRVSPPVADFITGHPDLKPIVRAGLVPAVAMSTMAVNSSAVEKAAILGLLLLSVALAIWGTRRRGRSQQQA